MKRLPIFKSVLEATRVIRFIDASRRTRKGPVLTALRLEAGIGMAQRCQAAATGLGA